LFYRSLTHWIGGIGIIVLVIIVLPSLKVSGYQLFSLESSLKEKILPKTKSIGFRVLIIYLALTIAQIILLWAGDMNLFDSICHAFGTIATGGFSTKNNSLQHFSSYSQYIVMLFMFLAGISQIVYYYLLKLNFRKVKRNDELWFYMVVVFIAGIIATILLFRGSLRTFEESLREGFFQVVSIITCTGFASADYLLWPYAGVVLVFILMFAGGSTGSTSGGIKMARHLIILKNIKNVYKRLNHPRAYTAVLLNGTSIHEDTNITILSFVILYIFLVIIATILLLLTGVDLITSASASATCMAGIGPGLGVVGPMSNYAALPGISKLILTAVMITGRLEILTVFTLFTKSFWKI
jgi:trk system potassium uptake protein TrkH